AKEHMAIAEEFEKSGVYRSAIDSYRDSLRYNPKNDYALSRIATLKGQLIMQAEGRPGNLITIVDKKKDEHETKVDSEAKVHLRYLKGKAHLQNEDYSNAIDELTAVLIKSPSYKDARKLLEQAKAELRAEVNEHLKMGMAYFQNEQIELAIEEWDVVLDLDPDNKTARDYRARARTIYERLETIKESGGK
ncbi:MAG: hypothetical protein OEV28_13275, partial [Nitrospirota bacterium]|nr:hypothetical protein [Nitrospirota bacterium]